MTAAIAAYPELGNATYPLTVSRSWGVHTTVLNLEENTLRFFENVLDEVLAVFPSHWTHLGGDECPSMEWTASSAARRRMTALGLGDGAAVQDWFINHMCRHLANNGRTPIVWDEAATDALHESAIVMAWRHEQLGIEAAKRGHQVIMTPMQSTYFDWYQTDEVGQPVAHPGGVTTLRDVFGYDPKPNSLDPDLRERIIGTQGQVWGEFLPTPQRVDDMAYPRLCALAERAWSQPSADYPEFLVRLRRHASRLTSAGVGLRPVPAA
jgi:hexosaminidase